MNTTRSFHRPSDDRVIAGVSSAIARRLDIGVGWVRIAFVIATFFGGLGFLLYLLGWIGIPDEGERQSIAERTFDGFEGSAAWIGGGLMLLAGIITLSWLDIVRGDLIFAAALFALGLAIYKGTITISGGRRRDADDAPGAPDPGSPPAESSGPLTAVVATQELDTSVATTPDPHPGPYATTGDAHPLPATPHDGWDGDDLPPHGEGPGELDPSDEPPPTRPRSYLGRLTFAAMLIALGLVGFLDSIDAIDADPRHYVATVVLVSGAGLIVGSLYGRARGFIAVGILATPLLLAATAFPLSGEIGDIRFTPQTVEELDSGFSVGVGQLVVDLRDLEPLTADTVLEVEGGIGHVVIYLPDDTSTIVEVEVGIGEVDVADNRPNGFGVDTTVEFGDGSTPLLTIEAELGIGQIEIIE